MMPRSWGCMPVLLVLIGAVIFLGQNVPESNGPPGLHPAIPIVTAVPTPAYSECVWMWANEDQPDLTAQLGAALDDQGIDYSALHVFAFGENCGDSAGNIAYFAAMETDFELTLTVSSVEDREMMGQTAAAVLAIIVEDFPVDSTPGPMAGRIRITFSDDAGTWSAMVRQDQAATLLDQGLSGAALIEALEQTSE